MVVVNNPAARRLQGLLVGKPSRDVLKGVDGDPRRALQFALAHHRKGFPFIAQRSWIVVTEPLEVR